jgi:ABC-2 type transport system ATP-binding protein
LDEVEKVCTHVAILQKGELITAGDVNEVLVNEELVEVGSSDLQQLHSVISTMPGISQVKQNADHLQILFRKETTDLEKINQFCFEKGVILNHLQLRKKSLESKFIELTKNNGD